MSDSADFSTSVSEAYSFEGSTLELGKAVHDGELHPDAAIRAPLSMLNRHGLIAGATGTGKTVTLRVIAEQLADQGVPVFMADVKGDLTALRAPGEAGEGPAANRASELGIDFEPATYPVEFLSLGGIGPGVPVRATVSDFGPQLLGKIMGANQTQEDSLALVFRYADDKGLPLVDLTDLRALLTHLDSDEGKEDLKGIGGLASATVGVLLRSLVKIEDGGGNEFFGEPMFEIEDLIRTAEDGRGIISCLELAAAQDKPELFSTAMMWMLGELFEALPEVGDSDKPKLVFFFDEAHLLFEDATDAFIEAISHTVRLIRSKGVGIFFVTQQPTDIHEEVLAQLGNRVQHALRAFTPKDQKALRATASTFPTSDFYDVEELLSSTGIGEAAVTLLSEKGAPTPVVHAKLPPPRSLLGNAEVDVDGESKASEMWAKYGERVDNESAAEILGGRLADAEEATDEEAAEDGSDPDAAKPEGKKGGRKGGKRRKGRRGKGKAEKEAAEKAAAAKAEAAKQDKVEKAKSVAGKVEDVSKFLRSTEGKKISRTVLGILKKR